VVYKCSLGRPRAFLAYHVRRKGEIAAYQPPSSERIDEDESEATGYQTSCFRLQRSVEHCHGLRPLWSVTDTEKLLITVPFADTGEVFWGYQRDRVN